MNLEKTLHINILFSYYKSLLTPKQQEYMQLYYEEDLSLGEISELYQVTRQAVYDTIKRTESALATYENKLQLVSDSKKQAELLSDLKNYVKVHYPQDEALQNLVMQLTHI